MVETRSHYCIADILFSYLQLVFRYLERGSIFMEHRLHKYPTASCFVTHVENSQRRIVRIDISIGADIVVRKGVLFDHLSAGDISGFIHSSFTEDRSKKKIEIPKALHAHSLFGVCCYNRIVCAWQSVVFEFV